MAATKKMTPPNKSPEPEIVWLSGVFVLPFNLVSPRFMFVVSMNPTDFMGFRCMSYVGLLRGRGSGSVI
jgi:hypothetical protein